MVTVWLEEVVVIRVLVAGGGGLEKENKKRKGKYENDRWVMGNFMKF